MIEPSTASPHAHAAHCGLPVSDWVRRWSHLVPARGRVLDLACGSGRHTRWFHARGCDVTAVDRDAAALQGLQGVARICIADIEAGPWPLPCERFDAVVVTNYLWRPLLRQVAESLAEPGVLIYETFATGNASVGKPSNPDFLLRPGELLQFAAAHGLRVVAYEDGFERDPDRYIQRIVAMRPGTDDTELHRHPLRGD